MTLNETLALAEQLGFSHTGPLNMDALQFQREVRDMCTADRCRNYGRCWTCPPYCGSLEEIAEKAAAYSAGILVQSTGQMEDDFDVDCILATEHLQKERFLALTEQLHAAKVRFLPMSAGACSICKSCTCPDAPCRFPEKAIPSMEAYGLMVSQVCQQSGLPYYYGLKTVTYTSCVLLDV